MSSVFAFLQRWKLCRNIIYLIIFPFWILQKDSCFAYVLNFFNVLKSLHSNTNNNLFDIFRPSFCHFSRPERCIIKLRCDTRFQRSFTTCSYVFKVITLVWANQRNFFGNATTCSFSKRTLKLRVATHH